VAVPELSPIGWALRPLRRYAEFSGRSPRAEFWWFFPFLMPVFLATWLGVIIAIGSTVSVGDAGVGSTADAKASDATDLALGLGVIFLGLCWLALIVPTVAVQTRRLHDTNRSGWWIGAFYLPYAACIALLIGSAVSAAIAGSGAPAQSDGLLLNSAVVLWLLLFLYSLVLLVFFSLPGTEGPNRFGDDPYGAKLERIFA
jgi:uncharacterized membrane protein YhaH (DUF805 family)